ncbi:MAG: SEC-C metal-binding domain-containing protein [Planctomycetota bacterium]|nr:SEC-C metal-binding domain-containing protein [Planctomycetota bacterium]
MKPVQTIRRQEVRIGPNAPCPCGSGRKYKKCCGRSIGGPGASRGGAGASPVAPAARGKRGGPPAAPGGRR